MKGCKRRLAAGVALALALGLCACGGEKAPAQTPTDQVSPVPQTFDLGVSLAAEPESLDPAMEQTREGQAVLGHIFEGLVKWEDGGKAAPGRVNAAQTAPGQAESWERTENADGTATYTFHLRADARWSDGKSVTAQDFAYAWRRLVDPATGGGYSGALDCVVNAPQIARGEKEPGELGVEAVDDKTFAVTVHDVPYFIQLCALSAAYPLRQDVVESGGSGWGLEAEGFVCNGPYRPAAWDRGAALTLVPNETYYDPGQGPDSILFYPLEGETESLSAYEAGQVAYTRQTPPRRVAELLANGSLRLADCPGTAYVTFQTQAAPFDDPLVRQAFALAVDREYLAERVTQSGQRPAGALVPPGVGGSFRSDGGDYLDPSDGGYAENLEQAKELLAQAGYPDGEGFPAVEYLYAASETQEAVAKALRDMWQEGLGVTVTLSDQPWDVFCQTCRAGDFALAQGSWTAEYSDPMSFLAQWVSGRGGNWGRYGSADYDKLVRAAQGETDAQKRGELLHRAEALLVGTDWALCPLYFQTDGYLLDPRVAGACRTPAGWVLFSGCAREG